MNFARTTEEDLINDVLDGDDLVDNGSNFSFSGSDSGSPAGTPPRRRSFDPSVFDRPFAAQPPLGPPPLGQDLPNFAVPQMEFSNAGQVKLARTAALGLSLEEMLASVFAEKFKAIEAKFTSLGMLTACYEQRFVQLEGAREAPREAPRADRTHDVLARVQALEHAFAARLRYDDSPLLARLEILEHAQRVESERLHEVETRLREKALASHLDALTRDLREAAHIETAVASRVTALEARRQEDVKLYDRIKFLEEFNSRPSSPTGVAQVEEVDFSKYASKKDVYQVESRLGCRVDELQMQISAAFPQKKNRNF